MKTCQECQTELWTIDVPVGRTYRCAVCGAYNEPDSVADKTSSQPSAWWSVSLGAFCIIGLVTAGVLVSYDYGWLSLGVCCAVALAGFVAVYLGVAGSLKMRYQKATRPARWAAICGTISGGVFGVVIGGLISVFGIIIGVITSSTQTFEGTEACISEYQKLFHVEFPSEHPIQPYLVRTSALQICAVNFRDNEESGESDIWLQIQQFPKWTTTNRRQFTNILRDEIYDQFRRSELELIDSDQLDWRIADRDAKVTRINWERSTTAEEETVESTILQYYSLLDVDHLTYGIVLIHRADDSKLDEQETQAIFESFRPANNN